MANHYHKTDRFEGTLHIHDLSAFQTALPDMSDNQLTFLMNVIRKFYRYDLPAHRQALISELSKRAVSQYLEVEFNH